MNRVLIYVANIYQVLQQYDQLKIYRSDSENGTYLEITTVNTRVNLNIAYDKYSYIDANGTDTHWYKATYYNSQTTNETDLADSVPLLGGSPEKVGYTFNNYTPPPGEWGVIYTADDMRYTMLFGIDSQAADTAKSEFTDEQFDNCVREALGDFEAYLTMDIRRRIYKTFNDTEYPQGNQIQAPIWREGIDFTDYEESYAFDPRAWIHYGFIQLRHFPVISVERAVWYSPVQGEIMDMIENRWLRLKKGFGQIELFPTGGFNYGPYSVYGPLWSNYGAARYPGGFEFDYTTGYVNSDFVPSGLRTTIGKYAAIKALAIVGDGLLAGFSSQSISLDGLSESFSSTQSATSAYFGARIKQYSDEITEWLKRNRYKYAPIPIGFVGAD